MQICYNRAATASPANQAGEEVIYNVLVRFFALAASQCARKYSRHINFAAAGMVRAAIIVAASWSVV